MWVAIYFSNKCTGNTLSLLNIKHKRDLFPSFLNQDGLAP